MVGFNRESVLRTMEEMDAKTYTALLGNLLGEYAIKDPKTPITLQMLEAYLGKVIRPFVAELIEKNNQQISRDLERAIKSIEDDKKRRSF